jgi:hypothetical protein
MYCEGLKRYCGYLEEVQNLANSALIADAASAIGEDYAACIEAETSSIKTSTAENCTEGYCTAIGYMVRSTIIEVATDKCRSERIRKI